MWKKFFTILIIPSNKQKKVLELKIYWLLFLVSLILGGILIYLIGIMYYQVFYFENNIVSIDNLNIANQNQAQKVEEFHQNQIKNFIEIDLLNTSQQNFINNANQATNIKLKKINETDLIKQVEQEGILSIIAKTSDSLEDYNNLENIYDYLIKPSNIKTGIPNIQPVTGIVLGEFGISSRLFFEHDEPIEGIILGTKQNEPVLATADGIIVDSGLSEIYGYYLEIFHTFGTISRYFNIEQPKVKIGDEVILGQQIANIAINPKTNSSYLYFQIISYGIPQNPLIYFNQ